MTLEEAKTLKQNDIIYSNSDNSKWKVTSVKVWKRNPSRIEIGLKHGLYTFAKVNESQLHLIKK